MFRHIYLTLLAFTLLCTTAQAQHVIRGTVTDEAGDPLPGATVSLKQTPTVGTTTDVNGHYALTLKQSTGMVTLQVTYVGYLSATADSVSAERDQTIDFALREDAIGIEQIVVTGTRTPKMLKDAPIVTRVISEADIRKVDATHIGDLLQSEMPGLEFSYAMNQQVSLNMQGFGGNTVLFLVDGERLAGETMDNVDYARLNLDNVGRIEIVKGAASSLYGSNAVGGVINLISRENTEPWTVNLNGHYGDHNEQRYSGTVSFRVGRVTNSVNIQHTTKDQVDLENDGDFSTIFGSRTWNFKERLVYQATDRLKFIARAGYFFRQRNYSADEQNRYRDFSGGLRANWTINDSQDLEVAYQYDQYDKSDYYPTTTRYDIKDYSNVQHSVRALYNNTLTDAMTLTVGADLMRDYLMSYQFEDNGSNEQYTGDAFAQLDWNVTDRLNLIAGARFDYYSESDVHRLSPKIGAMYKLDNHFTLRGSYSGGFRAPSLKEMYMSYDMASIFMLYGNPDLKSETSHNFQVSGEYTHRYLNATLSGFYNIVDNRITSVWDEELYGMLYSNMSEMNISGLEANVAVKLPFGVGARVSYCYTHEHMKKGEIYQSYTMSSRPHTATVRVEYGRKWKNYGFNLSLSGRLLSPVDTFEYVAYVKDETGTVPTQDVHYPGYTIWKLMLSQDIWRGISLTATVDNLFDYVPSYYHYNSPWTVGTTLAVSLSVDIDKMFR